MKTARGSIEVVGTWLPRISWLVVSLALCLTWDGFGATLSPLMMSVVEPPTKTGDCGGYEFKVHFSITQHLNGWIIQHIRFKNDIAPCPQSSGTPAPVNPQMEYWEAWRVQAGQVFIGDSTDLHEEDVFRTADEADDAQGHISIEGGVGFFDGYSLDESEWPGVPEALSLPARPSSLGPPPGFLDSFTVPHTLTVAFSCCDYFNPQSSALGFPLSTTLAAAGEASAGEAASPRASASAPSSAPTSALVEPVPPAGGSPLPPVPPGVQTLLDRMPAWTLRKLPHVVREKSLVLGAARAAEATLKASLEATLVRSVLNSPLWRDLKPVAARVLIAAYVLAARGNLDALSKIYLFNRLYFKVPPGFIPRKDAKVFGGWRGVPLMDGTINVLWPLTQDLDGHLSLTGQFKGYFGEKYRPLEEFDYFLEKFGTRY